MPHTPKNEKESKPRGKITEWSASSRGRLKRFLGTLEREAMGAALVITLTYPAEFPAPDDCQVYKGHLHTLTVGMKRRWARASGIWKLEFQARGAAHYHLMIFGLGSTPIQDVRNWIQEAWYRIAHNGDKHLGVAGTQVEKIKSVGGSMSYFAKYLSKGDQTLPGNFSGRYWGKINVPCIPSVEPQTVELSEKRAFQIRRIARKKMEKDVNGSRWKRWIEKNRGGSHDGASYFAWESAKAIYQGGAERVPMWKMVKGHFVRLEEEGVSFQVPAFDLRIRYDRDHFKIIMQDLRLPQRWKARNNDRVRLLCDASAFVEAIGRLDAPASSFLSFSRKLPPGMRA
jgi:hypothetical protein